jgi:spore germination cell wall hydrolase CwlJ-like protein
MLYSNIKLISLSMLFSIIFMGILTLPSAESAQFFDTVQQEEPIKKVSAEQVRCLATGIYYEAGYEPQIGQIAVARVIMNRVTQGFGSTPCKVVYQSTTVPDGEQGNKKFCQFSWACDGTLKADWNNQRYKQAEEIAKAVLTRDAWSDTMPNNVLFFHSTSVNPQWKLRKYIVIGNHVFYAKGREKIIKHER